MINAKAALGIRNVLFITFDTLRYDVAAREMAAGTTPNLQALLPNGEWEQRHTPGSFTYAAHHAFFAGFLPTPSDGAPHERLFALDFPGSETSGKRTAIFDAPNIIKGFEEAGYHTLCIGGVGFFNKLTPLGSVLPGMFAESHWSPELGVTNIASPQAQFDLAAARIEATKPRVFAFINLSAMHQPNCHYVSGATRDTPQTQGAALQAVDTALGDFMQNISDREWLCVFCSDHGEAYGDDGFHGHRLAHESVWTVPYAEFLFGDAVGGRLK